MKLFYTGVLSLIFNYYFTQELRLTYYCSDVKIISERTGDMINRCELGLNRQENLSKLGSDYFYDERMDNELRNLYHFGEDIFHYPHDTLIKTVGFNIFTNRFKLLFDNQFLVEVGNHIDSCFKPYAPIPIRDDRGDESAVIIYYKSKKEEECLIMQSFLIIRFNKKNKIVTQISDVRKPSF